MNDIVALRMDSHLLKQLDQIGKDEATDRSTLLRTLIMKGYKELLKEKAVQNYREGKITFSEAAHRAGLTLWEMENHFIEKGFKSSYSLDDLEQEMISLNKSNKKIKN